MQWFDAGAIQERPPDIENGFSALKKASHNMLNDKRNNIFDGLDTQRINDAVKLKS